MAGEKKEAGEVLLKKRRDGCAEMRGITVGEGWSVGEMERRKNLGGGAAEADAAPNFERKLGLGLFFGFLVECIFLVPSIVAATSLFIEVFRGKNSKLALNLRVSFNLFNFAPVPRYFWIFVFFIFFCLFF